MPLTAKREQFCQEYVLDSNGSAAAIRAGYSENGSRQMGADLLAIPDVQTRIAELRAELAAKSSITKQEIVDALAKIVRADSRKLYDEDGILKPITEWDDDNAGALSGFDVEELHLDLVGPAAVSKLKKVKQADKARAAEVLNKMLGHNVAEKREISGPGGKPIETTTAIGVDYSKLSTETLKDILNARSTDQKH